MRRLEAVVRDGGSASVASTLAPPPRLTCLYDGNMRLSIRVRAVSMSTFHSGGGAGAGGDESSVFRHAASVDDRAEMMLRGVLHAPRRRRGAYVRGARHGVRAREIDGANY